VAPARRVREGLSAIAFTGAAAALFAIGAAATVAWSSSMPVLCGGPMSPWARMPGETWPGAAASFMAMWATMMVPMMLPSLAPELWRYRNAIAHRGAAHWAVPTAIAAAGYFFVWALLGPAVYPLGALFAGEGTRMAAGVVVLLAGLVQFSPWKQKQLANCCPQPRGCPDVPSAWLHGMHLGVRCAMCCGNLMAIVLVAGVMGLVTMAVVTAAITLERVVPARMRPAQAVGIAVVGTALFRIARGA
jgi:predicted metal-binding membrane protein